MKFGRTLRGLVIPICFACAELSGCATELGTKVDMSKIASFQKGKTTPADVIAVYGPPNGDSTDSDGVRTIMYSHATGQADAKSYIPIAGAFIGKTAATSEGVSFFFKNGVLTDYIVSNGNTGQ